MDIQRRDFPIPAPFLWHTERAKFFLDYLPPLQSTPVQTVGEDNTYVEIASRGDMAMFNV